MSQTVITKAFVEWKAQQAADNQPVTLDEFIFAFVPDLDVTKPIDNTEAIPTDKIVYRQAVSKTGVVNANAVVYSVTMGADVGDFDFNWIGLTNKASGTLAMIIHAPTQRKIQNASGQQGNVLVRSMLMEYSGAQASTNITTPAETWQIDFTARLAGMDEADRLAALDIYGAGAFFDNGFLVAKTGTQYFVTKGLGYVGGLRAELAANQNVAVSAKPTKIWADVSYQGTLTSAYKTVIAFTVADTLENHITGGVAHYVFALASIDAAGAITDLRPKGSSQYLRRDKNLSDVSDPAAALNTLDGVPKTRKVNKKALTDDISLTAMDVEALPVIAASLGTTNINTLNKPFIGIYLQGSSANASVANGYPEGAAAGILEVFVAGYNNGSFQRYTSISGTMGRSWVRAASAAFVTDGPWYDWVESSTVGSVTAPNTPLGTVDLNTVSFALGKGTGIYYQSANANALASRNYPEAKAGTLFVTGSAYGCQQMYIPFDTNNIWIRGLSGNWNGSGPWRPWTALYGPNNKPSALDVGALPLTGGNLTGIVSSSAEIRSTKDNTFRIVNGDRGTFWRLDMNNLYLMITAAGDQFGGYNDARPIRVDLVTGAVYINDARPYSSNNKPSPEDLSAIRGDACNQAGFIAQNVNDPYMMYGGNTIVQLAPRTWVTQTFVQDMRFGTSAEYQERSNNEHIDGGVMTSFKDAGSSNYWIRVRQLQKLINNNWYTVSYT